MTNQQKTYTVYEHVNKTNGKRYIGATSTKPEKRWGWKGSNYFHQPFWDAIEEFGWDGFEHNILAEGLTWAAAEKMERSLIEKHKTTDPNFGYNIQKSSHLTSGYKCFTHS